MVHRQLLPLFLVIGLVVSTAVASEAQQLAMISGSEPTVSAPDSGVVLKKHIDEVNVVFTVTDGGGHFIRNLNQNSVELRDNDQPPGSVQYFRQQSDLPLRVALLIDMSSSIEKRFKFEQQAAAAFFKKTLRPGVDQAFVMGFDNELHLVQDSTDSVSQIDRAMKNLKPGGNTALFDAVVAASRKLREDRTGEVTRRAIILLTDGYDTQSRAILRDAQLEAARAEVSIFALNTSLSRVYNRGTAVLEMLCNPTGGHLLEAREKADLSAAFARIEEALRSQHLLGYRPANFQRDGSFHQIRIQPRKSSLKVQCRRGYFAPQDTSAAVQPAHF
ncbi:MAG: VWA domain-containing protein [Acidobacteriales bacterium]|nr:VWA domain-containing protein [Terriglobales bacterium]